MTRANMSDDRPVAEAQARRLLWLFPGWLRSTRGEEALGVVLDLVPEGSTELPWRSRLDLIRAGLQARYRNTVPLSVLLVVVLASPRNRWGHIPDPWRPWLAHRLMAPRWRMRFVAERTGVPLSAAAVIGWLLQGIAEPSGAPFVWALLFLVFNLGGDKARNWRMVLLERNDLDYRGHPMLTEPPRMIWSAPRRPDVPLTVLVGWLAGGITAGVAACVTLAILATPDQGGDGSPVGAFASAGAIAALGLTILEGRMHRMTGAKPIPAVPPVDDRPHGQRLPAISIRLNTALLGGLAVARVATLAPFASWWAVAAAGVVAIAILPVGALVVRSTRRLGRTPGLWDLVPLLGPQPTPLRVVAAPPPAGL